MKILAMIPARMGSQRLKNKNLQKIGGISLVAHAIRRSKQAAVFDEIWVNSEHDEIWRIAEQEGVYFHKRPVELANDVATSEDYIYEFLKIHSCDYIFQVHTIDPMLNVDQIKKFVRFMTTSNYDVMLTVIDEKIECVSGGEPINFTFDKKTNSQELQPVQRITWSIAGWCSHIFIAAYEAGKCATYAGKIKFYSVDRPAGHIIKTEEDLCFVQALYKYYES